MTLAADHSFEMPVVKGITYGLGGGRFVARLACKLCAVSLGLAAVMLWIAPGATWESDVMLFKLVLSIFGAYAAFALFQHSRPVDPPSIEIDVAQKELCLICEDDACGTILIERCAFEDLHAVDLRGRRITFWADGGRFLAEISLSNANAHATLLACLRGLGKLA